MSYKAFYAAFKNSQFHGNSFSKEEYVSIYTGGRTTSLKELSSTELGEITALLNEMCPPPTYSKEDKMRKAIIAIWHQMGRRPEMAKAWAERQGVRGVKKKFNQYTSGELYVLIQLAEKVLADWRASVRKQVTNKLK